MKIAQVCPYFYPEMIGGIEWYALNICLELVRQGHDLHIFTANLRHGRRIGPAEEVVDGIYVHRLPLRVDLTYRVKLWQGLYSRLTEEPFDLIHVYDYAQIHSFIATQAGRRHSIPTMMTVFDLHFMIPHPFYKRLPMTIFDRLFARWILRSVDKLLVRTPILIPPLVSLGARKETMIITPSGIRQEALDQANGELFRQKFGIKGSLVLYVGRLHPMKGPQFLIQAAPIILKNVSDASIVIMGPDQVNYRKDLLRLAKRLNVTDHIYFVEPIYNTMEKMKVYAACDVLALPSGYEGFGQVLVEAM
ncbi:MAG: glycosyltransferase family 4 protein, partial [Candidatus Hodarchaeota archaeon]